MIRILALETEWHLMGHSRLKDKSSIRTLMEFIETINDNVEVTYRTVATKDELFYYLAQLHKEQYSDYEIIYFAFHGSQNSISLSKANVNTTSDDLSIDELTEYCENKVKEGKIFHFGSCETFKDNEEAMKKFKKKTKAKAVSGYTTCVDFVNSSLLDAAYFNSLLEKDLKVGYAKKDLYKSYSQLIEELGFEII